MGKLEKRMAQFLPKKKKEEKVVFAPFEKFRQTWYLDWWLPKTLFIVGFLCILWKLFDITILGRFP